MVSASSLYLPKTFHNAKQLPLEIAALIAEEELPSPHEASEIFASQSFPGVMHLRQDFREGMQATLRMMKIYEIWPRWEKLPVIMIEPDTSDVKVKLYYLTEFSHVSGKLEAVNQTELRERFLKTIRKFRSALDLFMKPILTSVESDKIPANLTVSLCISRTSDYEKDLLEIINILGSRTRTLELKMFAVIPAWIDNKHKFQYDNFNPIKHFSMDEPGGVEVSITQDLHKVARQVCLKMHHLRKFSFDVPTRLRVGEHWMRKEEEWNGVKTLAELLLLFEINNSVASSLKANLPLQYVTCVEVCFHINIEQIKKEIYLEKQEKITDRGEREGHVGRARSADPMMIHIIRKKCRLLRTLVVDITAMTSHGCDMSVACFRKVGEEYDLDGIEVMNMDTVRDNSKKTFDDALKHLHWTVGPCLVDCLPKHERTRKSLDSPIANVVSGPLISTQVIFVLTLLYERPMIHDDVTLTNSLNPLHEFDPLAATSNSPMEIRYREDYDHNARTGRETYGAIKEAAYDANNDLKLPNILFFHHKAKISDFGKFHDMNALTEEESHVERWKAQEKANPSQ